jgi:hypothetical protein
VETVLRGLNVSLQANLLAAPPYREGKNPVGPRAYENEGMFRKNVNSEGSQNVCSYAFYALS